MALRRRDPLRTARRSAWVLLTLPPFTGWGAIVFAGVRARRRLWVGFGIAYAVLLALALAFVAIDDDRDGPWLDAAGGLLLVTWGVPFVHALVILPSYLERLELFEGERFDAAEDRALARDEARRLAERDPRRALELGIGRPDRDGFSGGLVDVNNAPVDAIEQLPGIGRELAERIVAVREEVNGFSSVEDLGLVLGLPAPLTDRIRPDVVFLPRGVS